MRYLVTHNVGNFLHDQVRQSLKSAATRWDAEYLEVLKPLGDAIDPLGSKLQMHRLPIEDGAHVLHVDGDVLIRDDAPEPYTLACNSFGGVPNWQGTTDDVETWDVCAARINRTLEYGRDRYISGGLYLWTKGKHDVVFEVASSIALKDHPGCYEQAAVSVAIEATHTPLTLFDWTWCRVGPSVWHGNDMHDYVYHFARYKRFRDEHKQQRYECVRWRGYQGVTA